MRVSPALPALRVRVSYFLPLTLTVATRNTFQDSLVRAGDSLQRTSEAPECVVPHRYQGPADGQHHLPCLV